MKYYITIPKGTKVGLSTYTNAWKEIKKMEPNEPVKDWQWFEVTARDVLRDMMRGLHDRINIRGARTI